MPCSRCCCFRSNIVSSTEPPTPRLPVPIAYKDRVRAQFKTRAPEYDTRGDYHTSLAHTLIHTAALQPDQRVLDVACGTGIVTLLAADKVGHAGRVTGIDISPEMLEMAESKLGTNSSKKNINFICMDVESAHFPANSFDVILSSAALVFMSDIPSVLHKFYTWIQPTINSNNASSNKLVFNAPKGFASAAFEVYASTGLNYYQSALYNTNIGTALIEDPSAVFSSEEGVRQLLQGAGFVSDRIHVHTTWEGRKYDANVSAEQYAEMMWRLCAETNPFSPARELITVAAGGVGAGDDEVERVVALWKDAFMKEMSAFAQERLVDKKDGAIYDGHEMFWIAAEK